MHQHFNTRKALVKRVLAYIFMVSAIVIGAAGATVWIMGYRFDIAEQTVERISLLQFQSTPSGAQIYVNDNRLSFTTPGRDDSAKSGANTVRYTLANYRDWKKTVNLKPAEVRWLNYARLVPNEIETASVANFSGYHQAVNSPNGDWIILQQSPIDRTLKLIDISDPQNVRVTDLEIPSEILDDNTETFDIIEWDSNSNHVLLQRNVGDQPEIISLDRRDPGESINLTKLFGTNFMKPHFMGNDSNVIFGLTDSGDLRRFEIGSKTISAPLVSGVTNYDIYGDGKLSYVAVNDDGMQIVGVYYRDKDRVVREFENALPTFASFVHYYRTDYLAIARGTSMVIINDPLGDKPGDEIAIEAPNGMDWLVYNGSGRFIVTGRGDNLISYDLETNESFNFNLTGLSIAPKWLDDYHLYYAADGVITMTEFDGANVERLVPAANFGIFSQNNRFLFTFNLAEGAAHLQRSTMILN